MVSMEATSMIRVGGTEEQLDQGYYGDYQEIGQQAHLLLFSRQCLWSLKKYGGIHASRYKQSELP